MVQITNAVQVWSLAWEFAYNAGAVKKKKKKKKKQYSDCDNCINSFVRCYHQDLCITSQLQVNLYYFKLPNLS